MYWRLEWSEGVFLLSFRLLFPGRKNCVLNKRRRAEEKGEETGEGGARVGQVTWDGGRLDSLCKKSATTVVKHPRQQMGPGDRPALQVTKRASVESCDAHTSIANTAAERGENLVTNLN